MKLSKKASSLCLSVIVAISLMPLPAHATQSEPVDGSTFQVVAVNAGIVTAGEGDDGDGQGSVDELVNIANASINSVSEQTYTGSAIMPSVTVTYGPNTLSSADYSVAYKNNVNVGTATIVVTGKGDYTGSTTATFEIKAASVKRATVEGVSSKTYSRSVVTPKPTSVKVGGKKLTKDTDYTLAYYNSAKNKKVSPKAAGTYYVRIKGRGNYTGTKDVQFKINKASVASASISSISAKTYNGSAFKPAPTVKVGGKKLTKSTDYTLSYKANTNAGVAKVVVTGKGNYAGSKSAHFKISRASIAKASVSSISAAKYTGRAIKPSPTVKVGNKRLKKGADYVLSYRNNVKAGTAQVVVTGKGNYQGARTVAFKIVKPAAPKPSVSSTVYITKSGKKYHRDGCSSLRKSKIAISRSDAIKRGYAACKNCRP